MSGSNQLHNLITHLLKALFEKEGKFLAKRQLDMVSRNTALGGTPDGFKHLGAIYSHLEGHARSRGKFELIHKSLSAEMDSLLSEVKSLAFEKDRSSQALALVLRDCRDWQEVRDALPNSLRIYVPECVHMERTKEEAFTLLDNPRAYEQYMRLRDKLNFYAAAQLLY